MKGVEQAEPEFFYDISSDQHLLGQAAYEAHIEAGGHPADIMRLGDFLASELEVEYPAKRPGPNSWSKQECLIAGHWLLKILPEPNRPKVKKLNERILRKAGQIGIMPGYRQISSPSRFGSFANFYKALGEIETHRTFTDITDDEVAAYVGQLFDELGRLPTVKEIKAKAKANPYNVNYETIYNRFGGLIPAAEAAGKRLPQKWSTKKLINWGVAFKIANEDKTPREKDVDFFSRQKLCVSSSTLSRRFDGRFTSYQESVEAAFEQLDSNQEYRAVFFKVSNGDRIPHDWVKKLRKPPEEKPGKHKKESAKQPMQRNWSAEELIHMGLDFMRANDGWVPRAEDVAYLCKLRLTPGPNSVKAKFGSFTDYQSALAARYKETMTEEKAHHETLLQDLNEGVASGLLPKVLVEAESEKIVRYSRYLLVSELLPEASMERKARISVKDENIVRIIRKSKPTITVGNIESHALALQVFDILWPSDLAKYKVPISPNRVMFRKGLKRKVD